MSQPVPEGRWRSMRIHSLLLLLTLMFSLTLGGCGKRYGALPDLAAIEDVSLMKRTFYGYLQPIAAQENSRILQQRADLAPIRARLQKNEGASWFQRRELKALARDYEVDWEPDDLLGVVDRLWLRVDAIPEELALAQAAKESGWGRSRFAVEVNNLFGQWCYQPGCGLVPKRRSSSATHEVAAFASVSDSVRGYMNNLNTHAQYTDMRRLRAAQRENQLAPTGAALAPGLLSYSERGSLYVDEILSMMQRNSELLAGLGET